NIISMASHGRIGPLGNTGNDIVTNITVGSPRFIGYNSINSIYGTSPDHTILGPVHADTNAFIKGIVYGQTLYENPFSIPQVNKFKNSGSLRTLIHHRMACRPAPGNQGIIGSCLDLNNF